MGAKENPFSLFEVAQRKSGAKFDAIFHRILSRDLWHRFQRKFRRVFPAYRFAYKSTPDMALLNALSLHTRKTSAKNSVRHFVYVNGDTINVVGEGTRHMTHAQRNQKILTAIAAETARAVESRKTARDTLIKEGIYTTKGELRAAFGGKTKKARAAA